MLPTFTPYPPACYGIVTVPTGPWYCRKCESQERQARVRCELCPSKDGALKRTDNGGWAHVVCALYIPEVRFGNVATMEPIILALVPQERYNKVRDESQERDRCLTLIRVPGLLPLSRELWQRVKGVARGVYAV